MLVIGRPTISAAVKPNSRSAASFQLVTTPSTVEPTTASTDDSTMAASRACRSALSCCAVRSSTVTTHQRTAPASSTTARASTRVGKVEPSRRRWSAWKVSARS